jgi:hypothetical protein
MICGLNGDEQSRVKAAMLKTLFHVDVNFESVAV